MYIHAKVCGLIIAAILLLFVMSLHGQGTSIYFSVLGQAKDQKADEVWLRPMMSPAMNFQKISGPYPPSGALKCNGELTKRATGEHVYKVLVLDCEGTKLELQGVDFAH